MNIRPETPADYAAIADLHVRAFGGRIAEALIVTLLRHRREFDPELSLVAVVGHRIVGHALFSSYDMIIHDSLRAVNLAPIGVEPNDQKQGIGKALIEEGHRIALSKGYKLSFLLGHDTYYPRFGYKTGVYGVSSVEVYREDLEKTHPHQQLEVRPPKEVDCITVAGLMLHEEYHVDFAILPSNSLLEWISPNPNIHSTVYLRDGTVVGYTRIHKDEPDKPRMFLAYDNDAARAMAAMLIGDMASIILPLHPYSRSADAFTAKPKVDAWNAGMACSLAPGPFDDYYAQLQEGKRLPGRVIWPVAFDLA
jgi:putative acetyltransferase